MPYTIKAVTKCLDSSLSDVEQTALIKNLYTNDMTTFPQLAEVKALRQAAALAGSLLSRASVISSDGKQIQGVQVWKNEAVRNDYRDNQIVKDYMVACRKVFDITISVISPPVVTKAKK